MKQDDPALPASSDSPGVAGDPAPRDVDVQGSDDVSASDRPVERERNLLSSPTGLLLGLACLVIVVVGMRYAQGLLNPILLAMFIVMGLSPVLNWMRRKGMPPWATLTIVIVFFVVLGVLFLGVFATSLGSLDEHLPVYKQNLADMMSSVTDWFTAHGMEIGGLTENVLNPGWVIDILSGLLSTVINALSGIVLMILIVIFMVSAVYSFPERVLKKMNLSSQFRKSFTNFGEVTRSYLFTKAWLSAVVAIIVTVVYYAFGVDFALLWGLLFFVLSFVPNIGFVLSVIPPFFVVLLESGFVRAAIVVIIVIVLNAVVDNGISPRVMARSVGLTTLTIFLSLVVWAWVLGGIGALISVPMTLMVKLLFFDSYPGTRPISAFMTEGIRAKRPKKGAPDTEGSDAAG